MHLDAAFLVGEAKPVNVIDEEADTNRDVPIKSAGASYVTGGMKVSGLLGLPNASIIRRIRSGVFAGVEEQIDKIDLGSRAAASGNSRNMSANAGSSCITRIVSLLPMLCAVQVFTAVAVCHTQP